MSCANARVTEVGLSGRELRGSIPEAMGNLGALRSLKLHDNFLTGTMPTGLGKLHLLRELQLSHNQLAMQDRNSLSEILGGLMYLRTLDMGMSDEKEDLTKTIVQPTPPLTCHVGEPCTLQLSTRTSDGLQLPHGGKQMRVTNAADPTAQECTCTDRMDGTYSCIFPPAWTSHKDEFDFVVLSADQEEFVPLRTLVDPTTGVESTVETYGRLGVIVPPIDCPQIHSYANVDGSQCVCEAGYYNMAYQARRLVVRDLCAGTRANRAGHSVSALCVRQVLCRWTELQRVSCRRGTEPRLGCGKLHHLQRILHQCSWSKVRALSDRATVRRLTHQLRLPARHVQLDGAGPKYHPVLDRQPS